MVAFRNGPWNLEHAVNREILMKRGFGALLLGVMASALPLLGQSAPAAQDQHAKTDQTAELLSATFGI